MSKLANSDQATMDAIDRAKFEEAEGKIVTSYSHSPVPWTDWQAHMENEEPDDDGMMTVGRGATEAEAVKDLIEQVMDR